MAVVVSDIVLLCVCNTSEAAVVGRVLKNFAMFKGKVSTCAGRWILFLIK